MKNLFLGAMLSVVFLPQLSFAAVPEVPLSPQMIACNKAEDTASGAFFGQQGQERSDFIKAHQDIIDKKDRQSRAIHEGKVPPNELTAQDESTFSAFVAKQQSDKTTFLAKLYQDKADCVSAIR